MIAAHGPSLVETLDLVLMAAIGLTSRALSTSPARDLTVGQWRMLTVLDQADRGSRLTELAEAIGMSLPSASRMVSRLATRGLVSSRPDVDDRRAVRIELTREGRDMVEGVLRRRRTSVDGALGDIRLSTSFLDELRSVADALVRAADGGRP
ncbi:MAG TPA: MarR family transcriptional regulator [Candidatus Limnocylindrales bacterium]|nr:MarR family transcriptional regulator [Candidatus Limnocylindrales bacterium]